MRPYSGNKKTETKSSPEPPSKVLRTRYVNGIDKTHDEFEDYLIQPWHIVQETVSNALGKKASKKSDEESDDKAQEIETESSTTPSSFLNTGVTLSHGFQLTKSMYHSLPTVRSVLYVPHSQQHVSLDSTHLHVWKGGNKIHRFSAVPPRDKIVQKSNRHSKDSYLPGLAGLSEWIYLEKYRMYVVATKQLELKLLDLHFDEIFSYSNPMPILSLAHDPSSGDIICGEVGGIRAFRLNVGPLHQGSPSVTERLHIPLPEEWCTCVYYDRMWNRIFGACGTNLYVFDFVNGERLDNYYDIHELTITCIAFYEPMEYLITGAKDGTIKIRNARKYLLFDFHEHFNAVTGFLLMETVCEANRGTLPLLISSSLDCTIRMWNFETGQSLYRLDVSEPCLGIGMIKKHYFHHFCPSSIQIWNVNRYQHTFAFFRSKPQILRRMTEENKPSRILTSTADSSIKLISPVTGATLSTGFPSHTEATVRYVAYNMKREMVYCLNTNDELITYESNTNPFKLVHIHELSRNPNHEPFMCCTEANYYRYKPGRDKAIDSRLVQDGRLIRDFYLFFGTASGQIVGIDVHGKERKEYVLTQAHSAAIDKLRYDSDHVLLLSGGKDKIIKVWEPRFSFERPQLSATRGKQDLLLVTHLHCVATVNIQAADFNTCAFSIFPSRKQFAVPFNGGIIIGEYDRDNTLEQRPFNAEEQSVGKVLFIDVIEEFGYYAAANSDNTVKIWDQKMRLVREIQFNEPIASMCIANKRGDLLVGLSDQISLVRIQDYIPPNVLQTMITKELTDDIQEAPLAFDSQLEFWNLQYEKESSKGIVEDWHMTKNVQQMPKFDEQDSLEALLEISRQRRAEAQKKMNKRKFLEDELQAYLRSLNEKLAYLKGEEEQNNLGSQEWPSQPALVELMEPSTPTHEKELQETESLSGEPSTTNRPKSGFERRVHEELLPPVIVERRESLLKAPQKPGGQMANSVFISKLVSHVEDRARRDSQLGDKIFQDNGFMVSLEEEKEVEKAPIVQETPKEPKDAKLKGMMSKHRGKKKPKEEKVESTAELYQDYITEDQLELVEEEVVPKKKKTKKHKPKEVPKEEEEEVVETVFEQVDHEISEPVKPLVEKAAEKIEEKVVEQVFKQDIQQVTVVPQVVVEQKDLVVPAAPVVEQIPIKEPELVVKTMVEPIAEPVAQKAPMEETKPTEIVEERPPDAILTEPVVRITRRDPFNDTTKKPPLLKPAKEQKQKPKIKEMLPRGPRQKKTQDYASHGGTYKMAQDIKSTRTDLDDIIPVFTEAALASATFVWDLLRKVRDPEKANSLPPSLKLVLDMLAQLNPSTIRIPHLSLALGMAMSKAQGSAVIELSNAAVSMFNNFTTDIPNVYDAFVLPHIEHLQSPDATVRKHMAKTLMKFGNFHQSVLSALIEALNDADGDVVATAVDAIAHFGITNTKGLEQAMAELGLIESKRIKRDIDYLDILYHRLEHQVNDQIQKNLEQVKGWLLQVPSESRMKRADSYIQHLAGPFFPPDATEEERQKSVSYLQEQQKRLQKIQVVKKSPSIDSFANVSNINGWGTQDLDKCLFTRPSSMQKRHKPEKTARPPKAVKITIPMPFSGLKTPLQLAKKFAGTRPLSASIVSARMSTGKQSERDILNYMVTDKPRRPFSEQRHRSKDRQTPYRPFTSDDSRITAFPPL